MIFNVRTWWNSVWSNSERQGDNVRQTQLLRVSSCWAGGDIYGSVTRPLRYANSVLFNRNKHEFTHKRGQLLLLLEHNTDIIKTESF